MSDEEYRFLSRCIYTARQNISKEDLELPSIALYDMYDNNEWLMLPAWHNEDDSSYLKFVTSPELKLKGELLPVNTEGRFFRNKFGTDLMVMSVREIFDIALKDKACGGLILNPYTDCEAIIDINIIKAIKKYFKKNETKK